MFDKSAIEKLSEAEAINAANSCGDAYVALPSDFKLHSLESYQLLRRRERGHMKASDMHGFFKYVFDHCDQGGTIFIEGYNGKDMSATAVLNLGVPDAPGHADNTSTLSIGATAEFSTLKQFQRELSQKEAAEFIEDWSDHIQCFGRVGDDDDEPESLIQNKHAISALRVLTIKSANEVTVAEKSMGASKSAFQSVSASSRSAIPSLLYFTCTPFLGLASRQFNIRLGIKTGSEKPMLLLRIINIEKHVQEMNKEFGELIEAQAKDIPVVNGSYTAK